MAAKGLAKLTKENDMEFTIGFILGAIFMFGFLFMWAYKAMGEAW